MKPAKIDVAVLLIFFTRADHFEKVFEQVKKARPSRLYLYQDGARENNKDDIENIEKCRKIAEDIDWECEVHRKYQEKNVGCDPSEYIAQKWMFEKEEMGIILEDDDVPSQSFFPFCKELLEKYRDDERIGMICGMNHFDEYGDPRYDYFFSTAGAIWGWATWKRIVDSWEEHYDFLDDSRTTELLLNNSHNKKDTVRMLDTARWHKDTGKAYYESIVKTNEYLYSWMRIIPRKNMISNIGVGKDGVHTGSELECIPKAIRNLLYKKTFDIDFPMRHPKYIINDRKYAQMVENLLSLSGWGKFKRKWEVRYLKLKYILKKRNPNG